MNQKKIKIAPCDSQNDMDNPPPHIIIELTDNFCQLLEDIKSNLKTEITLSLLASTQNFKQLVILAICHIK